MAVWSTVAKSATSSTFRLDAEFYQPEYLQFEKAMKAGDPMAHVVQCIMHPVEITRVYVDEGIRILLAQNIRPNRLEMAYAVYMPHAVQPILAKNRLNPGDVVMTRSGANFGDTATFFGESEDVYACADCLVIRPSSISGGYLSTFLNTRIGRALLDRGSYGAAQPHIAPSYLRELRIPRLGTVEATVDSCVRRAHQKTREAAAIYAEAEALLESALGLDKLDLTGRLFYERPYAEVQAAERFDAEYFQPRMQNLIAALSRDGQTIADVTTLSNRRFKAKPGVEFQYIEIGDLSGSGTADSNPVAGEEAPSRATWIVEPGDITTTTVRPIRRLSAIITDDQTGYVCSSGFAVLTPKTIAPELLLVYLRLPLVCKLLDLHTTASMYPAISTADLLKIPIALPNDATRQEIVAKVSESLDAQREARRLLDEAKAMVEKAIPGNR